MNPEVVFYATMLEIICQPPSETFVNVSEFNSYVHKLAWFSELSSPNTS